MERGQNKLADMLTDHVVEQTIAAARTLVEAFGVDPAISLEIDDFPAWNAIEDAVRELLVRAAERRR